MHEQKLIAWLAFMRSIEAIDRSIASDGNQCIDVFFTFGSYLSVLSQWLTGTVCATLEWSSAGPAFSLQQG